jgi:hypothetical protein
MQYILLIYGDEQKWGKLAPGDADKMYAAYMQYSKALVDAGVMRGGSELKPTSSATTVRTRNGKVTTVDGPFAETKEQLGGYYVIEVPNLEKALEWAAKCPGAQDGSLEVRPLAGMPAKA